MTLNISLRKNDLFQQILEEKVCSLQKHLGLHDRDYFEINLILDEMCTNIFDNNTDNAELVINIEVSNDNKNLNIVFQDNGIPFNPGSVSSPDIHLPLTKRQAGGLGLFFVKHYTDHICYQRVDNTNQTTLKKVLR
jgi:anti-sigma regulatory factor (Ser/Thr protein kinase)